MIESHFAPHDLTATLRADEAPCPQEVDYNALATYLRDHLAGGDTAIATLHSLESKELPTALKDVINWVVPDIEEDKRTLEQMIHSLDVRQTWWRRCGAWVAAKISSWKFWHRVSGDLGHLEVLELLSIGILGKRALWRVLAYLQATSSRFAGVDFRTLIARAEEQYDVVEHARMRMASEAFLAHRDA